MTEILAGLNFEDRLAVARDAIALTRMAMDHPGTSKAIAALMAGEGLEKDVPLSWERLENLAVAYAAAPLRCAHPAEEDRMVILDACISVCLTCIGDNLPVGRPQECGWCQAAFGDDEVPMVVVIGYCTLMFVGTACTDCTEVHRPAVTT